MIGYNTRLIWTFDRGARTAALPSALKRSQRMHYSYPTMTTEAPNSAMASSLATAAVGHPATDVRRFSTGAHHYVFEVTFADRSPVVVRIAAEHSRAAMAGALKLSHLLRPLGVPLPEIIADGVDHRFSHLVMERLPGTDLGETISGLSDTNLEAIAMKVAQAQNVTSKMVRGTRYGYGVEPAHAPSREVVAGSAGQPREIAKTDRRRQTF
jgi:hypothetical protein